MRRESRLGRDPAGFTLVEMMVTVAIVGILATLAVPSYFLMIDQAYRTEARGELGSLYDAETAFFSENTRYGCFHEVGWTLEGSAHFAIWLCDASGTGCTADPATGNLICDCVEVPKDWAGPGANPGVGGAGPPSFATPTDLPPDCSAFKADQLFEADADNWCRRSVPTAVDAFWITSTGGKDIGFLPYEQNPPDLSGC